MSQYVQLPNGDLSTRRYDVLIAPAWPEANPPETGSGILPTIKLFVDEKTSTVVTKPAAFERHLLSGVCPSREHES